MSARPQHAAESDEYRRALDAQQDYDSTPEGRRELEAALAAADAQARRPIRARIVSGAAARRFRREQAALMPAPLKRSDPRYEARRELAAARESIARALGYAAAEADAFSRPTPATMERLSAANRAALDAAHRAETDPSPHAHLEWPGPRAEAPWAAGPTKRAEPGDVAILLLLGVDARWVDDALLVDGHTARAESWGYRLEPTGDRGHVVTSRPDVAGHLAGR